MGDSNKDPSSNPSGCFSTSLAKESESCHIPDVPSHVFVVEGCPVAKPLSNNKLARSRGQIDNYDDDDPHSVLSQSSSTATAALLPLVDSASSFPSLVSLSSGAGVRNVSSHSGYSKSFSILVLKQCLESCIRDSNGEIDLGAYLDAYKEICKFVQNAS